jgi:superfamily II DNA/RNA helicase
MCLANRVGRTARNGKAGRSVSFVTQYDIEAFQSLETLLGTKLPEVGRYNWRKTIVDSLASSLWKKVRLYYS